MKKLPDGDFLLLMSSFPAKQLEGIYRRRWCIEVLFQNFKKRGFDLKSTHLRELLSNIYTMDILAIII